MVYIIMKNNDHKKILLILITVVVISIITGIYVYINSDSMKTKRLIELGNKYLSELNYEQAVVVFNGILELDHDNEQAFEGIKLSYLAWGESEALLKNYDHAIEILEKGASALQNNEEIRETIVQVYISWIDSIIDKDDYGQALSIAQKAYEQTQDTRIEEKVSELNRRILEIQVNDLLSEANEHLDKDHFDDAIEVYKSILEIDKNCVEAYIGIVECYTRMGDIDNALLWAKAGYEQTKDEKLKQLIDDLSSDVVRDSDGNVIKVVYYDSDGTKKWYQLYSRNGIGEKEETKHYDMDGNLVASYSEEYDDEGHCLTSYSWSPYTGELITKGINQFENDHLVRTDEYIIRSGEHISYTTYEFDNTGKPIREDHYNLLTNSHSYTISLYDSNGNSTRTEHYSSSGELLEYTTYEHDSDGELITKHYDGNGNMTDYTKSE